jgi:hypothetical protein
LAYKLGSVMAGTPGEMRRLAGATRFVAILTAFVCLGGLYGLQPAEVDAAPTQAPFGWSIETADAGPQTGVGTSIALAESGDPLISYINNSEGTIQLAHRVDGIWNSEIVAGPSTFVGQTSIVLGRNGTIETTFFDLGTNSVEYAVKGLRGWQTTAIDSGFSEGYNRLALDSAGRPAVAYTGFEGSLRFATWNGTEWSVEIVDRATVTSRYPDLVFDPLDRPNIAYYGNGTLLFAQKNGGRWIRSVVDPTTNAGLYSRIRLDSRGVVHIAYRSSSNESLMYATKEVSGWSRSVIDSEGDTGFDVSLAIDSDDRAQVAYYSRLTGFLRYAVETAQGWIRETVDDSGIVGWYTGIATDGSGLPRISYYDWSEGNLRYAEGKVDLQVRSLTAVAIGSTSVLLRGELISLGSHSRASVGFALRAFGMMSWTFRGAGNVTAAGTYLLEITNLTTNLTYEFRAFATAGNDSSQGTTRSFRLPYSARAPEPPYALVTGVSLGGAAAVGLGYLMLRRRRRRLADTRKHDIR